MTRLVSKVRQMSETKVCTKCRVAKPKSAFHKRKGGKNWVQAKCKACALAWRREHPEKIRTYAKTWRRANPERLRRLQRTHRLRAYGLTEDDVTKLKVKQEGRCAICRERLLSGTGTHIDHDHATGCVRGLLCPFCNHMLGNARDNPEYLIEAARYLRRRGARS